MNQLKALKDCGLVDSSEQITIGVNGGDESLRMIEWPVGANLVPHGTKSRNENLTIREIEKWLPGHDDYYVLYLHSKGAVYGSERSDRWRERMMYYCVWNWLQCLDDLDAGHDACGCHWLPGMVGGTQNMFGGNFWWAKASFLAKLPSILERTRIKVSGIESLESRYEAEVWIGNGPAPNVKDYFPGHPNNFI